MDTAKLGMSVEEAADICGIGRTRLYDAMKHGRLKARKDGRRTIIILDDLKSFLLALPEKETAAE